MKKIIFLAFLFSSLVFADTLQQIRQKKEIRIGVWDDQAPFGAFVNDKFEGFEIDMAKRMGQKIVGPDGKVILVAITDGNQRLTFLEQNKIDITLASFTKTKERSQRVDFSMPYFSVAMGALTSSDSVITKIGDLSGKTIVVQDGTTAQKFIKTLPDVKVLVTDTTGNAYRALKDKKADVFINDNLIVMAYPIIDDSVVVPETMRNLGSSDYLALAVSKGNKELLDEINKIMIEFSKDGFFKKIYNDTFGPFYRNMADPKYFLLEDLYRIYG